MSLKTVRVYMRISGQPRNSSWSNTFHMEQAGELNSAPVAAVVQAYVDWMKGFHLTDVQFDRAVVSTTAAEGRKGHPEAFKTIPLSGFGTSPYTKNDVSTDHLPSDHVLEVQFEAANGRPGKNLFRRCISGFMWTDQGGVPKLDFAQVNDFFTSINNGLDPAVIAQLRVLSKDADGGFIPRTVLSVEAKGIANRQLKQPRRRPTVPESDSGLGSFIDNIGVEIAKTVGTALTLKAAGKLLESPAAFAAAERLGITAARLLPALAAAV